MPDMLYWGEYKEKEMCKVCNRSKWKLDTKGGEIQESNDGNIRKKVPAKVLRYFPIINENYDENEDMLV